MIHTTQATYLALNKIEGFGVKYFMHFEENYPDITQILTLSDAELLALNWQEKHIHQWRKLSWKNIETELNWAEKPDCHILNWHDSAYPRLLKEIHRPPVILYVQGQCDAINRMSMGIVGTRHPTPYGRENAKKFSQELAEIGFCICSGLAMGTDGVAHQSALSYPTGTTAVVATGLDQIYPVRHQKLAHDILENGAIISEFPFKTPPRAENFPRRNRIISGLSRGVLVIEAALKSGSLITARYALEQGREVFAIPGSIQNTQAHGCHELIRQGAVLVNSIVNIFEELNISFSKENNEPNITKQREKFKQTKPTEPLILKDHPKQLSLPTPLPASLPNDKNYPLLEYLHSSTPTSIDQLIEQSGLLPHIIIEQLLTLELLDLIQKAPSGGYYRSY